ncbi:MAG: aminotransferase class I/II-fold pyridoxal phosphate-dependent enzyme, partial [Victivallaceae bacterium]|nr:aminotransferase class I/II-fold pyridoxal phosphate-dependent enzyme [Victivallaceae bacterium]
LYGEPKMKETTLALNGGQKTIISDNQSIFHWPIITDEDFNAVKSVMIAGAKPSGTDITMKFEKEWASYNGVKYALGTCNGTAALAAGLWALGVGAGDEIIAPSMTYWASCACAIQLGASVNFADVDPETLCIDAKDVEKRIGPRTKVIVVVNYGGYPADWDALLALAKKYNLRVLEDNSHGHGAMYKGKMCGSFGDIAGASMMSCKGFAIGEAGMITTDNLDLYKRTIAYGHYERTIQSKYSTEMVPMDLPDIEPYPGIPIGGSKHRMNQMCSAMGRVQLQHFPERIAEIDKAMTYFSDCLDKIPGLRSVRPPKGSGLTKGSWYFPLAHYDSAKLGGLKLQCFIKALNAEGVPATCGANKPLHRNNFFHSLDYFRMGKPTVEAFGQRKLTGNVDSCLPVTACVDEKVFTLPWFKHFDIPTIDAYISAYQKVVEHAEELLEQQRLEKICDA